MKNLVFDVNVILDLWLTRHSKERSLLLAGLLENSSQGGYLCWVSSASLHVLEYIACRELKKQGVEFQDARRLVKELLANLLKYTKPLSNFGFQQDAALLSETDMEDAQVVRAAARLCGRAAIITNDKRFDTSGTGVEQLLPEDTEGWLRGESARIEATNLQSSPISFIDIKSQQDVLRLQLEKNIHQVLHHGQYILGPEVKELEGRLAAYVGVKHAVTCASGTDALLMPLLALGISPGDAVFTTPFTFIATAEVISLLGATPVFVDIDLATFNIDCAKLDAEIVKVKQAGALNPKAIIPVDLFGLPADYDAIMAIGKRHGLFVLEDAAQSFGAQYHGRRAGSLAHAAATSFFPAKPLGCYGDGGAVFTDDDEMAEKLISIRVHGKGSHKYDNVRVGLNGRMDTLQAAILLPKLAIFDEELAARQKVAAFYSTRLARVPGLSLPSVPRGLLTPWAQYSILARDSQSREQLQGRLKEAGIPTMIYYPKPLHLQTAFAHLGYSQGDLPHSEDAASRIFSLPMHPYLEEEALDLICSEVEKTAGAGE